MTEPNKIMETTCYCCGEEFSDGLYPNPWCSNEWMSRECIMMGVEQAYNHNYNGSWDLDTDIEYWKNEFKKILEIRRYKLLDIVIRPLQRKIKEMLNSPHNRRGRSFIESEIEWAFE